MNHRPIYGVVAEFDDPGKLVEAARAVRDGGFRHFEAYTPYPVKELDEIVPGRNPVALMVLVAGIAGTATAWGLEFYIAAIDYPTNIGGRPLNSWPSFIPIMFELTVLFAACMAFFGTLWLCGLPWLHHPIFNVPEIHRATRDRFFLCIEGEDWDFDPETTADFLAHLEPLSVSQVAND